MKNTIAALFSSLLFLSPVMADEISLVSQIDQVTVYPRGAEVTRIASGKIIGGSHVITIGDLPGRMVSDSVRVEGRAGEKLEIVSVDVRQSYVTGSDNSSQRARIEGKIEALNDEIAALNLEISNANTQHLMLQSLAGQAILPRKGEANSLTISADELNALLSMSEERFARISQITEKARIRQRNLSKNIEELRQQLSELAPKQELRTLVAINLEAAAAGEAEFYIRYNVEEAGWAPIYDAKLILGAGAKDSKVNITRRANVRQATTENWQNIALTLSTARPKGNTQAPVLKPYILSEYQQFLAKRSRQKTSNDFSREMVLQAPTAEDQVTMGRAIKPKRQMEFSNVAETFSGFLAEYNISGLVSVSNAGSEKNVTIDSRQMAAIVSAIGVPKIDPAAYLTAKFKLEGEAPWLPGVVMLSRDQVFLGKTRMPLLNPGQEFSLGFGRDDFVRIERVQVSDKKGKSGFITSLNVAERKYVTTVTNLHDFPMRVIIKDTLPYATHEDIEVELMGKSTKPTRTDVEKQRGLLEWEYLIGAKAEMIIEFGYKVSWPKDMKITPVK